jgi:NADH dehydrogenase (ubiquinone) 1 beta subcomplex subunit 3
LIELATLANHANHVELEQAEMGGPSAEHHAHKLHLPNGVRIPDWREYKVSREINPELWRAQERLAREGLKDPWSRNNAWRFQGHYNFSPIKRLMRVFIGLPEAAVVLGVIAAFNHFKGGDDHGHGHGHGHDVDDKYKLLCEMETKP